MSMLVRDALLLLAAAAGAAAEEWPVAYTGAECAVEYQLVARSTAGQERGSAACKAGVCKPSDPGARSLEECVEACTDAENCVGVTFFTGDIWIVDPDDPGSAPTDEMVHAACCGEYDEHRGCDDVSDMPPPGCTGGYYSGCSRCTSLETDAGVGTSDLGYTYTTYARPGAACPGGGGYTADTTCATCPAGRSSASGGNSCRACARNRYAPEPNQAECLGLCPSGKVAQEYGSTAASDCSIDCGAGNFSHSTGCVRICPADSYQDEAKTGCIQCPDHKSTSHFRGATDIGYCSACVSGYYAVGGLCSKCPVAAESNGLFQIGGVLLLALGGAAWIYKLAQKGSLEDEQAMESKGDSAKAVAKDLKSMAGEAPDDVADDATASLAAADEQASHVTSMSAMLAILFPSLQISMMAWTLDANWPPFMDAIAAWMVSYALLCAA